MSKRKGVDYPGISITYFCHDGQGNFVMHRRSKYTRDEHGVWDIGGGGLKLHDTVENTLRQEIKEEYCTEVIEYEFLGYQDVFRKHNGEKTHWLALNFKVLVDPSKVKIGEPDKFDKLAWFTLDNLPDNLHSQLPWFFREYKDKLKNSV